MLYVSDSADDGFLRILTLTMWVTRSSSKSKFDKLDRRRLNMRLKVSSETWEIIHVLMSWSVDGAVTSHIVTLQSDVRVR